MRAASRLLLFDIDGTLIRTGDVDVRATNAAFEDVFGLRDVFTGIKTDGRTVTWVLDGALQRTGLGATATRELRDRWKAAYLERLAAEVVRAPAEEMHALPGAEALVHRLSRRDDTRLGLITGNYPEAARLKLEPFDLWQPFSFGGFGDDGRERSELVPAALARARERGYMSADSTVVVIGDTPHDVHAAHAHGVRMIAIATGPFSPADLRAAGAETVIAGLAELEGMV